jgi:predicted PurR-regulated permease PerM
MTEKSLRIKELGIMLLDLQTPKRCTKSADQTHSIASWIVTYQLKTSIKWLLKIKLSSQAFLKGKGNSTTSARKSENNAPLTYLWDNLVMMCNYSTWTLNLFFFLFVCFFLNWTKNKNKKLHELHMSSNRVACFLLGFDK